MSPADRATMSPGTSSRMGSSDSEASWPPPLSRKSAAGASLLRRTVTRLLTRACRRAAARRERPSWTKRSSVDSSTMLAMTMVAFSSSVR